MSMYSLRAASSIGRLTRRAHPHSVNTLRLDVPVDDVSTLSLRPRSVLGTSREGGTSSIRMKARTTHQAFVA